MEWEPSRLVVTYVGPGCLIENRFLNVSRDLQYFCCKSSNLIVSSLIRPGNIMPGQMAQFGGYRIQQTLFSEGIIGIEKGNDGYESMLK